MKKLSLLISIFHFPFSIFHFSNAQQNLTPEKLWELGRVSALGISKDGKSVVYSVKKFDVQENTGTTKKYIVPLQGGNATEIENTDDILVNTKNSADKKSKISFSEVKIKKVFGNDFYPELEKSDAMIYDDLNYRHWDTWEDGLFSHVFLQKLENGKVIDSIDLMSGEPYDCPQKPFGGDEDAVWNPDGKNIAYVTKKKSGKDYAVSTNTDIFSYNIESKKTTNLSSGMMGYDIHPEFSSDGTLAWLSMERDGYESDKNDIIIFKDSAINVTRMWDGTVNSFKWSNDGKKIFFTAPIGGTVKLMEIENPFQPKKQIKPLADGDFDVSGIVGQSGDFLIVTRTDMNHAAEIFTVEISTGKMQQITHVNDEIYKNINTCKVEKRWTPTTDGQKMLSWVIYPPDFNPAKKYPVLLYCQGGPQSPLTQYYSFRWNFQLFASNGYIVVAPNRRGMPGHGVKWNEQISKDYSGQVMRDYLSAIDDFSKDPFVDKSRIGCIGASFGGYSVFYLAGIHNKRFKTFVSHAGIFNLKSMYGTTEELFFVDWDFGGNYWDKKNAAAQKTYSDADPSNLVEKWDTPILILQGGKDYRVPYGQAMEAFQAAQLKGIKSRFVYLPNENHWILQTQNALVWQREIYRWLKETL